MLTASQVVTVDKRKNTKTLGPKFFHLREDTLIAI